MKRSYILLSLLMLTITSCTTQKRVENWLDNHPDKHLKGDTTYIYKNLVKEVTIEVPADTVFDTFDCDDITDTIYIKDDSAGIELMIAPLANIDEEDKLFEITATTQTRYITQTIHDTIEVPVAVEYTPDVARYQLQADQLKKLVDKYKRKANRRTKFIWFTWVCTLLVIIALLYAFYRYLTDIFKRQ